MVDGGNEWFPNSQRRATELKERKIMFVGMGISGGEEGARNGPSLMPGGPKAAFDHLAPIIEKCAAQVRTNCTVLDSLVLQVLCSRGVSDPVIGRYRHFASQWMDSGIVIGLSLIFTVALLQEPICPSLAAVNYEIMCLFD